MTDFTVVLIGCLLSGFISASAVKAGEPYKLGKTAVPLIKECEAELPRNEQCTLIAVRKETKQ